MRDHRETKNKLWRTCVETGSWRQVSSWFFPPYVYWGRVSRWTWSLLILSSLASQLCPRNSFSASRVTELQPSVTPASVYFYGTATPIHSLEHALYLSTMTIPPPAPLQHGANPEWARTLMAVGSQVHPKPWCVGNECSFLSKSRNVLSKTSYGLGLGLWGSCDFGSWEPNSSHKDLWLPVPRLCMLVCDTLEIPYVPFVQYCLVSFLLTSSHCMTVFCWLCPLSPLSIHI